MRAIVEEAEACKSYVCAHAYNSDAIARALKAGVRSIEHGNMLNRPTAELMKVTNRPFTWFSSIISAFECSHGKHT